MRRPTEATVLEQLTEPRSTAAVAVALGCSPSRVRYVLEELRERGLIEVEVRPDRLLWRRKEP